MRAMFSSNNFAVGKDPDKKYSLMTELKVNFVYPSIASAEATDKVVQ